MIYFILLTSCVVSLIIFILLESTSYLLFKRLKSKTIYIISKLTDLFLGIAFLSILSVLIIVLIQFANIFF